MNPSRPCDWRRSTGLGDWPRVAAERDEADHPAPVAFPPVDPAGEHIVASFRCRLQPKEAQSKASLTAERGLGASITRKKGLNKSIASIESSRDHWLLSTSCLRQCPQQLYSCIIM